MKTVVLTEGTLRYFETEKGFHAEDESGKRLAEIEETKCRALFLRQVIPLRTADCAEKNGLPVWRMPSLVPSFMLME